MCRPAQRPAHRVRAHPAAPVQLTAWNEYLVAYTFMKDQSMYTLPIWLASFSNPQTGTDFGGQMAASVLFSLPVVVFFLLIQRKLVAGMSAGAVKG